MQKILIMGLPGAGKTYLANEVKKKLQAHGKTVEWFNADVIRQQNNDWDFSVEGRIRQSIRMKELAKKSIADYVICDFVAPLIEMRDNFAADYTIWLDTINEGRFADTNAAFVAPTLYDFRITEQAAEKWAGFIVEHMLASKSKSTDTVSRSLAKAITWRVTGTVDTFIVSWFITGQPLLASSIALTEILTKVFLFWIHERVWTKVHWGK